MTVMVAALGPVMLGIAGRSADGTILWLADHRAIAEHIAPRINQAANQAGRSAPRIVAGLNRYLDAGATDLSIRLLPIGEDRETLIASKHRSRQVIADIARDLREPPKTPLAPDDRSQTRSA
jgi:alkanesulfonate monooxygenase SsuD/methylene tetrahydromethanopterin reductase-like flavin-dependent oxidoreductase (luciferase family)